MRFKRLTIWIACGVLLICGLGIGWEIYQKRLCISAGENTVSIIGGADGPTAVFLAGKTGSRETDKASGGTTGLLETAAGSWRLAGVKTEEHLAEHESLQSIWGTGIHYGSSMEIGEDGSFSFGIAIHYGGSGTVSEENGVLSASIIPYALEYGKDTAGTPDALVITPVEEDGILYLTTPYSGETMYWERAEG